MDRLHSLRLAEKKYKYILTFEKALEGLNIFFVNLSLFFKKLYDENVNFITKNVSAMKQLLYFRLIRVSLIFKHSYNNCIKEL